MHSEDLYTKQCLKIWALFSDSDAGKQHQSVANFYCTLPWACTVCVFSARYVNVFILPSLSPQRSVTGGSWSKETGHQPCQLWAKEILFERVYLWGGGPGALSWPHATAQRDDGQISYPDGSVPGVRGSEGKQTVLFSLDNNNTLWQHVWFYMIMRKERHSAPAQSSRNLPTHDVVVWTVDTVASGCVGTWFELTEGSIHGAVIYIKLCYLGLDSVVNIIKTCNIYLVLFCFL